MGTVMDIISTSTDYVDHPYWSVMQIKVKRFGQNEAEPLGNTDYGKVILVAGMTLEKRLE